MGKYSTGILRIIWETEWIFINLPLLFLFRSFGASVFITNFTASILYSLIIFISFYTIIRNRKKAYAIAGLTAVSAFVILHAGFQGPFYYDYVYDVVFFEELGHSMRTTRAFLPFNAGRDILCS